MIPFSNFETRDGLVVSTVEKVIGAWFSRVPNGSMLKAIQKFNLEKEEDGIRQLLFGLFRCQNYSLEKDYQLEYISEASTFLWLTYLEYVKQHGSVSLIGTFIYLVLIPSLLIAGRGMGRDDRKIFTCDSPVLQSTRQKSAKPKSAGKIA